jgi:hypothetical protein
MKWTALVFGMVSIVATWAVVGAAFVGLGLATKRILDSAPTRVDRWTTPFWVGFALTILFLQIWHLAFRVSSYPLCIVLALGALGLWWNRVSLSPLLNRTELRRNAPLFALLVLCALWVANAATASGDDWDYGVYHLPAVRWTKTYPIVPGLGNLHGRLAFNSSYYLYAAMLDVGPWSGKSNHLANGLLVTAFLLQVVVAIFQLTNTRERGNHRYGLELGLLTPAVFLVLRQGTLASVMPDVPVAIVLFIAAAKLFNLLTETANERDSGSYDLIVVMLLLTVATCIKLSAVGFAIPAALLGIVWWWTNRCQPHLFAKTLVTVFAIVFMAGGTWMIRGILLSGYPAYPSTFLPAPVEWRVPSQQARADLAWTRHFGRWYYNPPTQSLGWIRLPDGRWSYDPDSLQLGWSWLPGWLSNLWRVPDHREGIVYPVLWTLLAIAVSFRRPFAGGAPAITHGWLLLVPTLAGMAWWFVTAPVPRFGFFLFWILAATAVAQTLRNSADHFVGRRAIVPGMVTLAIGLMPFAGRIAAKAAGPDGISARSILRAFVVVPASAQWFSPSPRGELTTFTTGSGLTLYVPAQDQRCWDAPLPCTPQPAVNLALRLKESPQHGFITTDGRWLQQDFPDPRTYRRRQRITAETH